MCPGSRPCFAGLLDAASADQVLWRYSQLCLLWTGPTYARSSNRNLRLQGLLSNSTSAVKLMICGHGREQLHVCSYENNCICSSSKFQPAWLIRRPAHHLS